MNGAAVASGMGTCGLVGQIGVYTGWLNDIATGTKNAIGIWDWAGLIGISFVFPAVLTYFIGIGFHKTWADDMECRKQDLWSGRYCADRFGAYTGRGAWEENYHRKNRD